MRLSRALSVAFLSLLVVAGCAGASAGWTYAPASLTPPPSAAASAGASAAASSNPNVVTITALNVAFDPTAVTAPAGTPFQIQFENKDAGTPHNVAIHQGGTEVFKGAIFPGVATQTYDVPALAAGQYTFVCSVHSNMTGTLEAK